MKIETIKERLRMTNVALFYITTVPEENIYPNLSSWRGHRRVRMTIHGVAETLIPDSPIFIAAKPLDCGSVACFGGWLPAMPEMYEKGVRASLGGAPILLTKSGKGKKRKLYRYELSKALFGNAYLLDMRGGCAFDDELPMGATDKAIVLHRLKRNVEMLERDLRKKMQRAFARGVRVNAGVS